jgi:hypothetical protein
MLRKNHPHKDQVERLIPIMVHPIARYKFATEERRGQSSEL